MKHWSTCTTLAEMSDLSFLWKLRKTRLTDHHWNHLCHDFSLTGALCEHWDSSYWIYFLHFHCLIVNIVSSICSLSFLFSAMCVLVLRYHMYGSDIGALGVYIGDLTVNGITSESRLQILRRIPPSGTSPICFISFDFLTLIWLHLRRSCFLSFL